MNKKAQADSGVSSTIVYTIIGIVVLVILIAMIYFTSAWSKGNLNLIFLIQIVRLM